MEIDKPEREEKKPLPVGEKLLSLVAAILIRAERDKLKDHDKDAA